MANNEDTLYREFLLVSGEQSASMKDAALAYREMAAKVVELADSVPQAGSAAARRSLAAVAEVQGNTPGATASDTVQPTEGNRQQAARLVALADIVSTASPATAATANSSVQAVLAQPLSELIGQVQALKSQTTATASAGTASKSGGDSALGAVASVASTIFQASLSPVLRGLIGLFTGGDDTPEPAAFVKYALPSSVQFRGASTRDGISNVDYDQYGMARAYRDGDQQGATPGATPQVTVNVQAMDARSFLDHSTEIAAAVREAMLNLNSINEVVADL